MMAALSEHDLRVIHGENYQETVPAESEQDKRRDARAVAREAIDKWENRIFTGFALLFIGCALMFSTFYSQTGQSFQIQLVLAVVFLLAGLFGIIYGRSHLRQQRLALSTAAELRG
jgi:hypothetical protein